MYTDIKVISPSGSVKKKTLIRYMQLSQSCTFLLSQHSNSNMPKCKDNWPIKIS